MQGIVACAALATFALAGCAGPAVHVDPLVGAYGVKARIWPSERPDDAICGRVHRSLAALYETDRFTCLGEALRIASARGKPFIGYDLVVHVAAEVMRERDYPTNMVDPIENAVIGRRKPFHGVVAYDLLTAESGEKVAVIGHIWDARDWRRYRAADLTPYRRRAK